MSLPNVAIAVTLLAETVQDKTLPKAVRCKAAKSLGQSNHAYAARALARVGQDKLDDQKVRRQATMSLKGSGDVNAALTFASVMQDQTVDQELRDIAAELLKKAFVAHKKDGEDVFFLRPSGPPRRAKA
uniref:HEAT repeat domain-containing protein n=1 Tax=Zooxanthella nutricula TaxID=1333877 RepID=A0A7S2IQK4_9DINO